MSNEEKKENTFNKKVIYDEKGDFEIMENGKANVENLKSKKTLGEKLGKKAEEDKAASTSTGTTPLNLTPKAASTAPLEELDLKNPTAKAATTEPPKPEIKSEPKAEPAKPEPKSEVKPEPKVEPPKVELKPEPKSESKAESDKAEQKSEPPKPESKPESKPEPKPEPKVEPPKVELKPEPKPESKVEPPKVELKPEPKVEPPKVELKPESKAEPDKPEQKVESKVEPPKADGLNKLNLGCQDCTGRMVAGDIIMANVSGKELCICSMAFSPKLRFMK